MEDLNIALIGAKLLILIISLSVHEWAHAEAAYRLGDDTADLMGRRTLNPIAHIDPVGTILFPLIGALGGIGFGWAKPVPTRPHRFDRWISMRAGSALVAFAGPLSNLVLAAACFAAFALGSALGVVNLLEHHWLLFFYLTVGTNLALAFFNLIPMPPLDGGWILAWLMPESQREIMETLERHGFMLLLAMIFAPQLTGGLIDPIGWLMWPVRWLLTQGRYLLAF